jgi:CPA1 family monovalent cation:H+ antiporter
MGPFLQAETLTIVLLLVVSLVAIGVRRFRFPYIVALVVVGLIITTISPLHFALTPELVLDLFVPPLVFEAAFHISFAEFRRNLAWILMLALPGVAMTMAVVAVLLALTTRLGMALALVFGAVIAATDPVAVVALFRTLRVPNRLSVLVEGESLANDGTAIVLFNLMAASVVAGGFSVSQGALDFLLVSTGGVLVGLILGWTVSQLISRVDDYLIETTLTTVLAFGSYLVAEQVHVSGVLAVMAAGLICGNLGRRGMSPTTRIVLINFWEYVAFLANSLVFLLIGLDVTIPILLASWQPILWAILAVLLARLIAVFGLGWFANRLAEPIPLTWKAVLAWGGLRGAVSLALALSLPAAWGVPGEQVKVMALGVVLFTILVQATTMHPWVDHLRIAARSEARAEYELRHGRLAALRAAEAHLQRLHEQGLVSTPTWEKLKGEIEDRLGSSIEQVRKVLRSEPALQQAERESARRELLRAQRSALLEMKRDGILSAEALTSWPAKSTRPSRSARPNSRWRKVPPSSSRPSWPTVPTLRSSAWPNWTCRAKPCWFPSVGAER